MSVHEAADAVHLGLTAGEVNNASHLNETEAPHDCECHNKGSMLPIVNEESWSHTTRAFLYFLGMFYAFMGIYVATNVFMTAIVRITSTTRQVKVFDEQGRLVRIKKVHIWNHNIAHLTLLAFGSSAPEIFLSIIELITMNFEAGSLGPSAIVGSAAYNLLLITSVTNLVIPVGESRKIKAFLPYAITSIYAVAAYLWMLMILKFISPDIIELWEGLVTMLLYAMLLVSVYLFEKRCYYHKWRSKTNIVSVRKPTYPKTIEVAPSQANSAVAALRNKSTETLRTHLNSISENGNARPAENGYAKSNDTALVTQTNNAIANLKYGELEKKFMALYPDLPPPQIARLVASQIEASKPHSTAYYRINSANIKRMSTIDPEVLKNMDKKQKTTTVCLSARVYHIGLDRRELKIKVLRTGYTRNYLLIRYETVAGTARPSIDYHSEIGSLHFEPDVLQKIITIRLPPTASVGPNEHKTFYVRLVKADLTEKLLDTVEPSAALIHIVPDRSPTKTCIVKMDEYSLLCQEGIGNMLIPVSVEGYCSTSGLHINWETKNNSAVEGRDFVGKTGWLYFEPGEQKKYIAIPIVNTVTPEKRASFVIGLRAGTIEIVLGEPAQSVVTILGNTLAEEELFESDELVPTMLDELQPGNLSWSEQFRQAANVNYGKIDTASVVDYLLHALLFPWKFLLAFCPPAHYLGGWLTFFVSLSVIGMLVALVIDFANIFGCLINLKIQVTAITFVVLGTGLPDLFASRFTAINEQTADGPIGHVLGDNCVNVFMGVGLPWTIGAAYHQFHDEKFNVRTYGLFLSIGIYVSACIACLLFFLIRRKLKFFDYAEMGGTFRARIVTFFVLMGLYVTFLSTSIMFSYKVFSLPGELDPCGGGHS